ncbi:TPA: hypothetical protein QCU24_002464 [Bacillus cereus]|nr:hypothetical protein [Bacillus cereus]
MNELLKQISSFLGLKTNSLEAFILCVFLIIAAWLIKEFKDIYSKERETLSLKQIEMKEKLSNVKLSIRLYRRQEIEMNELLDVSFKINAYLNYKQYKELKGILEEIEITDNVERLDQFMTKLLDTLMNQTQMYIVKDYSITQDFERFFRRVKDIGLPIVATFTVIFISCVLFMLYVSGKNSFWGAVRLYSFIFALSFLVLFINSIFNKHDNNKSRVSFAMLTVLFTLLLFFQNMYCLTFTIIGILGVFFIQKIRKRT